MNSGDQSIMLRKIIRAEVDKLRQQIIVALANTSTCDWDSMSGTQPRSLDGVLGDIVNNMQRYHREEDEQS